MIVLDLLAFEDRANLATVSSQLRTLALMSVQRLKIMKDLPCLLR